MNTELDKYRVFDPRIQQKQPSYQIDIGASEISTFNTKPNNASKNSLSVKINPPSQNVYIDRNLTFHNVLPLKVDITLDDGSNGAPDPDKPILDFGVNSTITDYPLNRLLQTANVSINNASISNKGTENFNMLVRMADNNMGQKFTPSRLDKYLSYTASHLFSNSNIATYSDAQDDEAPPNGSFGGVVFTDTNGNPLPVSSVRATYSTGGATAQAYIHGVPITCAANGAATGTIEKAYTLYFKLTFSERVFLSPFIFNEQNDDQTGLFGINSIDFTANLANPTRLVRFDGSLNDGVRLLTVSTDYTSNNPWEASEVSMTYRTPSLLSDFPKMNVVPYHDYTSQSTTRAGLNLASGATYSFQTDNYVLSTVPNMILVAVRPTTYSNDQADWFFTPEKANVNFGNQSSMLANMNRQQLYEMSVRNGLKMTWSDYSGEARVSFTNSKAVTNLSVDGGNVLTIGGFLALRPGVDFPLPEGLSGGIGQNTNFSIKVDIKNRTGNVVSDVTCTCVFVNSGFITSMGGSSNIVLNPVSEDDVLNAKVEDEPMELMVGGKRRNFFKKVGAYLKKMGDKMVKNKVISKVGKIVGRRTGNPLISGAAEIADVVGLGVRTGGKKNGLNSLYR